MILFHSWRWNYLYLRLKFSPQLGGFVSINSPQKVGNFIENCWKSRLSKGEFFPPLGSYSGTVNPRPKPKNLTSAQQTSADTGPPPALSSVSTRGPAQPSTANSKPKPKNSTSAQQTSASAKPTALRQTGNNTNTAALQAKLAALHGKLLLQCNVMPLIFWLAEVNRLKKRESAAAKNQTSDEVKHPKGTIVNLQNAMGLENKSVYMNCRVSLFFFTIVYLQIYRYSWLGNCWWCYGT